MMTYLLQVSICWIVLFGIYMIFLQKETFFTINRYYLLTTLLAGVMIPLLGNLLPANEASTEIYQVISLIPTIEISPKVHQTQTIFTWTHALKMIYILGVLLVFSRFCYGLSRIYSIYKFATKTKYDNYTLVESTTYHLPFSFFHYIFISKNLPLELDVEKVLKHEELHANQWHSLDIIITELLQVFFWFNPILILYKKALRQSHEYLADAYVTKAHNRSSYGQLLLRQSTSGLEIALANHFFQSQIKNRITMMYKEKSKKSAKVKYLMTIPVLAAMLFIFSSSKMEDHPQAEKGAIQTMLSTTEPTSDTYMSANDENFINTLKSQDTNSKKEDIVSASQELFGIKSFLKNNILTQGDPIFKVVEEMPRFPGCEDDKQSILEKENCAKQQMLNFIYENLSYPKVAKDQKIEGMCVVQFVVEKDGQISEGKIIRNIGGGCGEESLKAITAMPNWIPGKQKGKAVRVQFTLPIKFKLPVDFDNTKETFATTDNSSAAQNLNQVNEELFKVVEEMPRFAGCENEEFSAIEKDKCAKQKMFEFIYSNTKYPEEAKKKGIEGTSVVQLIIEKDGSVSSSKILRDPGSGTGTEAKRVIDKMPKWIPGKQNGENVRVQMVLPIKYKLEGDKISSDNPITSNSLDIQNFKISPNPSNGIFNLSFELKETAPAEVLFYSANGQTLRTISNVSNQFSETIDLSNYNAQIVYLKITQGKKVYHEKIIVQ